MIVHFPTKYVCSPLGQVGHEEEAISIPPKMAPWISWEADLKSTQYLPAGKVAMEWGCLSTSHDMSYETQFL